MGIQNIYKLVNKELFDNWYAEIQDWGSLHMLIIYKPNGSRYCDFWRKSLKAAKICFTKDMNIKGAIWKLDNSPLE